MMLAAAKVALSSAYILAALASCPAPSPPATAILTFTTVPPDISNVKSSKALGGYHISTTFSHSLNEMFTVGGLTVSDFAPEYLIHFSLTQDAEGTQVCLSPASVEITLKYAPRVFIASEAPEGSCRYRDTLTHEMRHVNTDIITFNELLPQLKQAVQDALDHMQPIGPMAPASMDKAQNIITDKIRDTVVKKVDEIEQIRFNRQQQIDTRQEYMRASKACPDNTSP